MENGEMKEILVCLNCGKEFIAIVHSECYIWEVCEKCLELHNNGVVIDHA